MKDEYKIISLEVLDFKRIGAASLFIGDGMTTITGANGAGKSSIIDAVFYALKPEGVEMPIKDDAHRAKITLRIGGEEHGYTIERSITESGKYLKVTNDDGKQVPAPQTFLNSLFVEMADPMVFMDMKPKDQCDALRIACKCDTRSLEQEIKETYDNRTIVNRRLDQCEKALAELGEEPEVVELKSVSELTNKSAKLNEVVQSVEEIFSQGKSINDKIEASELTAKSKEIEIDEVKAEIKRLQDKLDALEIAKQKAWVDHANLISERNRLRGEAEAKIPEYRAAKAELAKIAEEIASIDEHNKKASEHEIWKSKRDQLVAERNKVMKESFDLTEHLRGLEQDKRTLLEAADYPVEGMLIEGDKVYVGGVPFSNLNTAEKIKVATFVAIAQNPKLKVIIIRNGSMLDSKSMSIIKEIADERGYQILVEKVSEEPELDSIHVIEGKVTQQ